MATQNQLKERTKTKITEPKQYKVIMWNDDFTTMDFVVDILVTIFHKDRMSAESIMLDVHKKGQAVVGMYSYDVAATRIEKAMIRAKNEGFPFRMTMEEA